MSSHRELLNQMNNCINAGEIIELNGLLRKAHLQLANATNLEGAETPEFLTKMKSLLSQEIESELDYDSAIEIFAQALELVSFDLILELFSVQDLVLALQSNVTGLVRIACKALQRSDPKGLFASSGLIDVLLLQLFEPGTDLGIVTEIESVFESLVSDTLIRRRILSDNVSLLLRIKLQGDPILLSRLLDLLQVLVLFADCSELNEKLFIFCEEDIRKSLDSDIFAFIAITNYYSALLASIRSEKCSKHGGAWIRTHTMDVVLPTYGSLFANAENDSVAKLYGRQSIYSLFKEISFLDDFGYFERLESEYLHLSPSNADYEEFLKFVNPEYLIHYQRESLLHHIQVTPSHLAAIRNLISSLSSFELLKPKLTADRILDMPYYEQMVLLQKLTEFGYSAEYLLLSLSKVMSHLLDDSSDPVTEPQSFELRRTVLENLLSLGDDALNVWALPIKKAYRSIMTGVVDNGDSAQIADTYL
ncbi:LADA_0H12794g1_1 [Lachancea dasiensis]|uniref:DNA mismatch repair protein HSM3 n=1 Tax=Lachancea dasiensis TaxID=1072105 RepID=A0A1G4K3W2_9SACH|nr:LADA_0H12794g1_1 [Lachancea dasiensis]